MSRHATPKKGIIMNKKCVKCGEKGERYIYVSSYTKDRWKWGHVCLKCEPHNNIGKEWLWSQKGKRDV
jgi:hypothetical protein